jgi:hypothetical protein
VEAYKYPQIWINPLTFHKFGYIINTEKPNKKKQKFGSLQCVASVILADDNATQPKYTKSKPICQVVFLKRRNVMDKLYTCNEVADMFRVKVITVWDWIREGKLEALNIGSDKKPNYRVSEAHIEKFNK